MRLKKYFIALAILFLNSISSAWQNSSHDTITSYAGNNLVLNNSYPADMEKYWSVITANDSGSSAEMASHGGPTLTNWADKLYAWATYDGGPFDSWLEKILDRYKNKKFSETYQEIGYLVHLTEDQAVPTHAANISHGYFDHFEYSATAYTPTAANLGITQLNVSAFGALVDAYQQTLSNARNKLPFYTDPKLNVPYWVKGSNDYVGQQMIPDGHYGASREVYDSVLKTYKTEYYDTFSPEKSPTIIPDQMDLGVKYVSGLLLEISKKLPPIVSDLTISNNIPTESNPAALTFTVLENRLPNITFKAEIYDKDEVLKGEALLPLETATLEPGVSLPWEKAVSFAWDGRLKGGVTLPDGKYKIKITAVDADGNVSDPAETEFYVDGSEPEAKIEDASGNELTSPITADKSVIIKASDSGSGVCSIDVSGPEGFTAINKNFQNAAEAVTAPFQPTIAGEYNVLVKDCAGHEKVFSFSVSPLTYPYWMTLTANGASSTFQSTMQESMTNSYVHLSLEGQCGFYVTDFPLMCKTMVLDAGNTQLMSGSGCYGAHVGGGNYCLRGNFYFSAPTDINFTVTNTTGPVLWENIKITAYLKRKSGGEDYGSAAASVDLKPLWPLDTGEKYIIGSIRVSQSGQTKSIVSPDGLFSLASSIWNSAISILDFNPEHETSARSLKKKINSPIYEILPSPADFGTDPARLDITFTDSGDIEPESAKVCKYAGLLWDCDIVKNQTAAQAADGKWHMTGDLYSASTYTVLADYKDNLPPVTALKVDSGTWNEVSGRIYLSTGSIVSLPTTDDALVIGDNLGRGAATTYYTIPRKWTCAPGMACPTNVVYDTYIYTAPFNVDRSMWISFYSVDKKGNIESSKGVSVTADSTPPGLPVSVLADGANPSPWSNSGIYEIAISTPYDPSGINIAMVKTCGVPASNEDGVPLDISAGPISASLPCIANGANTVYVWLVDGLGNTDYNNRTTLVLRYDDIIPVSNIVSPSTASSSIIPVSFSASDEGYPATGSGPDSTALWYKHESDMSYSSSSYILSGSSGTFEFSAERTGVSVEGEWKFYTQAFDKAGNYEPVPVSTIIAKASTFLDTTPPVISNVRSTVLSPYSARIDWTTDDETTGIIDYGQSAQELSYRSQVSSLKKEHSVTLTDLPSPANIYFKIKAVNKSGLQTASVIGSFATPLDITYDTDIFGVIDYSQPVVVSVTNPEITYATITVDGFTWSGNIDPQTPVQVYIDTAASGGGTQIISFSADSYAYNSQFIIDTATRSVKLARVVIDGGGVMTSTAVVPGNYLADMTEGQALQEEMSSGQSKMFWGYYSGIDPVPPGVINDFSALAGPEAGQASFGWTSTGDDASVGTAMKYEIRYSTEPIDEVNFSSAKMVLSVPLPRPAGTPESASVAGLADGTTYYFAVKVFDELMNYSISNTASVRTLNVAQSGDLIAGEPVVQVLSRVPDITVEIVSTTAYNPALAIATAAASGQGLVFFSEIYEILPSMTLAEGATVYFRYNDPGPEAEDYLAVYKFDAAQSEWIMLASAIDKENNLISAFTYSFSLYAVALKDSIPPVTALNYIGGKRYTDSSANVFITSSTLLNLTAYDPKIGVMDGGGVARTEYKLDSVINTFEIFASPFALTDGEHIVQYRSADRAGNVEAIKASLVYVDGKGPEISYSFSGTTKTVSEGVVAVLEENSVLSLLVADQAGRGSGFKNASFEIDGASEAISSDWSKTISAGVHVLKVEAFDNLENSSGIELQAIVGDTLPPHIDISSPSAGSVFIATKNKIDIAFSVSDNYDPAPIYEAFLTQVEDRGSPRGERSYKISVSSAAELDPLDIDDGIWELSVSATDFVLNSTTAYSGSFEVIHDTLAPRTELNVKREAESVNGPDGTEYVTGKTTFTLTSVDDLITEGDGMGLGVKRQKTGIRAEGQGINEKIFENPEPGQGQIFVSTFALADTPDGLYTLAYNAEDIIGNTGEVKIATYAVDNTFPVTGFGIDGPRYFSDEKTYLSSRSSVSLAGTDPVVNGVSAGISSTVFKLDTADFAEYISSFTLTEGAREISYYSKDRLGNSETEKQEYLYVDGTPPLTSLNPDGGYYIPSSGGNAGDLYAPARFLYKLSAYDPEFAGVMSGLFYSEYRILALEANGTEPVEPSPQDLGKPFTPFDYGDLFNSFQLSEGINRVDYRSHDNVLNDEPAKTAIIYVDATPPVSVIVYLSTPASRPDGVIVSSGIGMTINSTDPVIKGVASGAKTAYFIENGVNILTKEYNPVATPEEPEPGQERVIPYYPPISMTDGYVELKGYSIDNAGNNETPFNYRLVLDNTAPFAFIISPATSIDNSGLCRLVNGDSVKIIGTVTDTGVHTDGKAFDHFSGYTLEYGWGAEPSSYQTIISSSPGVSLIEEMLGVWDTTGLEEGVYTLRIRAVDAVGNEGSSSAQVIISAPKLVLSLGRSCNSRHLGPQSDCSGSGNGAGEFNSPSYLAIDGRNNDFWVSDTNNDRVQKFDSAGTFTTEIRGWSIEASEKKKCGGKACSAKEDKFNKPAGLAVDPDGNLWVADKNNDRVLKFSSTGAYIAELGDSGQGAEISFNKPHGLAIDGDNNLWVADRNNDEVKKFGPDGELILAINTGLGVDFNKPQGAIAVDYLDRVYITDRNNDRVLVYDGSGNFIRQLGGPGEFNKPDGIFANALAYVYVADSNNSRIKKFDPYGNAVLVFNKGSNESDKMNHPSGVTVDAEGNLFVVDSNNAMVKKYAAEGELVVIADSGQGTGEDTEAERQGGREKTAKKLVKKAEGGKVYHSKGITVTVPAGALAADTEITVNAEVSGQRTGDSGRGREVSTAGAKGKKMIFLGEAVEFGPDGAVFVRPVEIALPYDSSGLKGTPEDDIKIGYYNPAAALWEEMPTTLDKNLKLAKTYASHFSIYAILAPEAPSESFRFGEVYVYPNPAVGGKKPTFHVECGIADKVKITVYTVSGRTAHEHTITVAPQAINDGTAPLGLQVPETVTTAGTGLSYAYEYAWTEHIPSGVYYYMIEAEKGGQKLKTKGKFAVIR